MTARWFFRRIGRRIKAALVAFRDANKPVPWVSPEPTMLASVPGDTVFALRLDSDRPLLYKGGIELASILEDGSLSYRVKGNWFPAHLTVREDSYKRHLVGLLKEHGYTPLEFEHIAEAMRLVVSESTWNDLLGHPDEPDTKEGRLKALSDKIQADDEAGI